MSQIKLFHHHNPASAWEKDETRDVAFTMVVDGVEPLANYMAAVRIMAAEIPGTKISYNMRIGLGKCSKSDNFCKKIGRERAEANAKHYMMKISGLSYETDAVKIRFWCPGVTITLRWKIGQNSPRVIHQSLIRETGMTVQTANQFRNLGKQAKRKMADVADQLTPGIPAEEVGPGDNPLLYVGAPK